MAQEKEPVSESDLRYTVLTFVQLASSYYTLLDQNKETGLAGNDPHLAALRKVVDVLEKVSRKKSKEALKAEALYFRDRLYLAYQEFGHGDISEEELKYRFKRILEVYYPDKLDEALDVLMEVQLPDEPDQSVSKESIAAAGGPKQLASNQVGRLRGDAAGRKLFSWERQNLVQRYFDLPIEPHDPFILRFMMECLFFPESTICEAFAGIEEARLKRVAEMGLDNGDTKASSHKSKRKPSRAKQSRS
jgi:hypothetical protein